MIGWHHQIARSTQASLFGTSVLASVLTRPLLYIPDAAHIGWGSKPSNSFKPPCRPSSDAMSSRDQRSFIGIPSRPIVRLFEANSTEARYKKAQEKTFETTKEVFFLLQINIQYIRLYNVIHLCITLCTFSLSSNDFPFKGKTLRSSPHPSLGGPSVRLGLSVGPARVHQLGDARPAAAAEDDVLRRSNGIGNCQKGDGSCKKFKKKKKKNLLQ